MLLALGYWMHVVVNDLQIVKRWLAWPLPIGHKAMMNCYKVTCLAWKFSCPRPPDFFRALFMRLLLSILGKINISPTFFSILIALATIHSSYIVAKCPTYRNVVGHCTLCNKYINFKHFVREIEVIQLWLMSCHMRVILRLHAQETWWIFNRLKIFLWSSWFRVNRSPVNTQILSQSKVHPMPCECSLRSTCTIH